ncbi:Phospholipase YtpA [Aquimixticola soesokkakensis]|uniref:Phospholipase YtpA n=1 Tax=Aquimixticola soesokkakensis TaxID=1519096 RepID=A0A1Y5SA48_9RHOB|nr:alpha/beta hydrolase [Aquimixticola soesokkakensis]SLN35999.1 Phospholipase YtpA [Aquimixticola soesokkakensis]
MQEAPFYTELAEGPDGGSAAWCQTSDGVRIRVGHWPARISETQAAPKGTVFLFPGRTEYIEKYGPAAGVFTQAGYAMLAIDWRGQGIADRLLEVQATGHVRAFDDYQQDVDAALDYARAHDLPRPWYLIGHSMGGAIGLGAVLRDVPFSAAAFSAPMWGIRLAPWQTPLAKVLTALTRVLGIDHWRTPGTFAQTYVLKNGFEGNKLTTDAGMYAFMQRQMIGAPALALGGPSMRWLGTALESCAGMAQRPAPALPACVFYGSDEEIVSTRSIDARVQSWPSCEKHVIAGARHEIMMETPQIQTMFFDTVLALFARHR